MSILSFNMDVQFGKVSETISVFYPNEGSNFEKELPSSIEQITNTRIPPSRLLIICPSTVKDRIKAAYDAKTEDISQRLRSTSHVAIAPYDDRGHLVENDVVFIRHNEEAWNITDTFLVNAAKEGISYILNSTNTILEAPSGYQFRKPSGREEDIFVRTGNMLREVGSISVFTHLLLQKLSNQTKILYIDSSTILSFAIGLQCAIRAFSNDESKREIPSIENILSYEKDPQFRLSFDEYLIIISASTSGGLAKELVEKHGADRSKIVHLLGAGKQDADVEFKSSCLYFHERKMVSRASILPKRNISIGSEEFIVSHGDPIPVRITKKNHIDNRDAKRYKDPFYQKNLYIERAGTAEGYGPYSLFSVRNGEINDNSIIGKWIQNELVHSIPASVRAVVYLDNRGDNKESELLGKKIKDTLSQKCSVANIPLISSSKLEKLKEIPIDLGSSVVVVASEDPGLEGFVQVSTSLRSYQRLYRYYVICHAFPESNMAYKRMVKDLQMRPGERRKYGWSEFSVTAIGENSLHQSLLNDYGNILTKEDLCNPSLRNELDGQLYKALEHFLLAKDEKCLNSDLYFPQLDGRTLELREGSVFFTGDYSHISQAVVYLVVAAALQRARESENTEAGQCFDDNPFVRSVIDPSMFSRFSDGVLQAALLRALSSSELDFSDSELLSRQFGTITTSVLKNCDNRAGEAALEFLAAVASRKVSLRERDRASIVKVVREHPALKALWDVFTKEGPM